MRVVRVVGAGVTAPDRLTEEGVVTHMGEARRRESEGCVGSRTVARRFEGYEPGSEHIAGATVFDAYRGPVAVGSEAGYGRARFKGSEFGAIGDIPKAAGLPNRRIFRG